MKTYIVDTREPGEYAQSHVDGAINAPASAFLQGVLPSAFQGIEHKDKIIVYCRTGSRSNTVAHILAQHGYANVENGINEHHVAKRLADD